MWIKLWFWIKRQLLSYCNGRDELNLKHKMKNFKQRSAYRLTHFIFYDGLYSY